MKFFSFVVVFAALCSGCVNTGSNVPHADSADPPAGNNAGPVLCRDGSVPPCTTRQ